MHWRCAVTFRPEARNSSVSSSGASDWRHSITNRCFSTIVVEARSASCGRLGPCRAGTVQSRALSPASGARPPGRLLRRPRRGRWDHRGGRGTRCRRAGCGRPGREGGLRFGHLVQVVEARPRRYPLPPAAEYRLVYENLAERQRLLDNAPHLVTPVPFLIPLFGRAVWSTRGCPRLSLRALALRPTGGMRIGRRHQKVSKDEALAHLPTLRPTSSSKAFSTGTRVPTTRG